MNHKKVLIVDDNPIVLRTTSMLLAGHGYDVVTALDGGTAVEKARTEKPDVILLDLLFPPDVGHGGGVPWDGFLIMSWLRRLDEAKDTPVIVVSSADPATVRERSLSNGVRYFFSKPVNKDQLLAAIGEVLATAGPNHDSQTVPRKRVLFVDDEGDWLLVAGAYLQEAGFEVVTARDVAETLHRSQKIQLDAIVLDVNLAGENSVLLMELLKLNHPGVPIIVYTGLEEHDDAVQRMLKQGARQFLRKGSMSQLCDAIRQAVN
jgi:CheY-like chemotaxis protein